MKYFHGVLLAFVVLFTIEVPFVSMAKGANDLKYQPDPLRYLGFLPGAHPAINLHKQLFYELLVKKGLVYMHDHDYDVDPDSPIIRSDPELGNEYGNNGDEDNGLKQGPKRPDKKTKNPKKVLVVGAGVSGLSTAYELKRAGHEVTILERESRAGGRIDEIRFHVQPSSELHGEAGAMRVPPEGVHYLVDAYINKFKLETIPFYNIDPQKNCFVSVEGETVRIYDFISDNQTERARAKAMCDKLWPGWDRRIIKNGLRRKYKIDHVFDYYKLTIREVIDSAPKIWRDSGKLSFDPEVGKLIPAEKSLKSPEEYAHEWREWMVRWSKMSFTEFLSSDASSSESKATFRPWPVEAINSLSNIEYLGYPEVSIATMLAETVGGWQTAVMRTLKGGMNKFAQAFIKNIDDPYYLENDIRYGITVRTVEWRKPGDDKCSYQVKVSGRQTQTGNEVDFEADAVILTLPLNILRQVSFRPVLPLYLIDAIAGIRYEPGTKIFLGFRERFWEKGKYPIVDGGISKTNLPISMIVYPRRIIHDDGGKLKRGVLLFYTFNKEALHFGSQSRDAIITEALRELQNVYEGLLGKNASKLITELFEFGAVHPWYDDSSAQGGWVHLLPYSYIDNLRVLLEPNDIRPIFFGGDAISFANGYIQGALESGLRAAWQFFKFNEQSCSNGGIPQPKTGQRPNPFNDEDFNPNERLNLPFLGLSKYPFPI